MIKVRKLVFNSFGENCYVVWIDGKGDACAVIDPGFDCDGEYDALKKAVTENRLNPAAVLLTHSHPDHVYGVRRLCEEFDIPVYMNEAEKLTLRALPAMCRNMGHADVEDFSSRIVWIEDGDRILVSAGGAGVLNAEDKDCVEAGDGNPGDGNAVCESGNGTGSGLGNSPGNGTGNGLGSGLGSGLEFKALLTPGHSADGVCYLCRETPPGIERNDRAGNEDENRRANETRKKGRWSVLFSGDTLFSGCIGRSDLPGGDYTSLMQSIFTKILPLDGDIDVLPGHGASTTIADERTKNPFLQPFNEPYGG